MTFSDQNSFISNQNKAETFSKCFLDSSHLVFTLGSTNFRLVKWNISFFNLGTLLRKPNKYLKTDLRCIVYFWERSEVFDKRVFFNIYEYVFTLCMKYYCYVNWIIIKTDILLTTSLGQGNKWYRLNTQKMINYTSYIIFISNIILCKCL